MSVVSKTFCSGKFAIAGALGEWGCGTLTGCETYYYQKGEIHWEHDKMHNLMPCNSVFCKTTTVSTAGAVDPRESRERRWNLGCTDVVLRQKKKSTEIVNT